MTTDTSTSTLPQVAASRHRAEFHRLRVAGVERLTSDAVTITFEVPPELAGLYTWTPGQHLTLRTEVDGAEVRRSYSICTAPSSGRLGVAVKRIEGGLFSDHANAGLAVGDTIEVMTPAGRFGLSPDPTVRRRYAAVVAGSGITPVMSIMSAVLEVEPHSTFTLVYGNRDSSTVMFVDEIADLKDRYPQRLQVVHVLSREPHDADLLHGRIDEPKLDRLLQTLVPQHMVDDWFLCGPFAMVEQVRSTLVERGVPSAAVHLELFHVDGEAPRVARSHTSEGGAGCSVTVRLDGRSSTFSMPDEGSVLDATLAVRSDAPFACKGGVCGTCRVVVREGAVEMARNYALEPEEIAAGYALACQSVPTSDRLVVDFDV